jgi:hypothetical protein
MSTNRPLEYIKKSGSYFENPILAVKESELQDYLDAGANGDQVLIVPENLNGIGPIRNFILRQFPGEMVIISDDDIETFKDIRTRKIRKHITNAELAEYALTAKRLGAKIFGFVQQNAFQKDPYKIIRFSGMVEGIVGVVDNSFEFPEHLTMVDAENSLLRIIEDRIVVIFNQEVMHGKNTPGGNAKNRYVRERERLDMLRRYFPLIDVKHAGKTEKVVINVKR